MFKKYSALLIALCMIISAAAWSASDIPVYGASGNSGRTAKVALSRKNVKLRTGKSVTVRLKNAGRKVRWKSSNTRIVRISKTKGKYRNTAVLRAGRKTGKCTVTATVGKKVFRCRITVRKSVSKDNNDGSIGEQDSQDSGGRTGQDDSQGGSGKIEVKPLSASSVELTEGLSGVTADTLPADDRFAGAAADFSFNILKKTVETDAVQGKSINTLVSPDSILTALVMTGNGAAGDTRKAMENALGGDSGISMDDYSRYLSGLNHRLVSSRDVIYQVADSIWTRDGKVEMKTDFLAKNKAYHDAEVYRAPFDEETVADMNKWVCNNTRNMIDKIIERLDADDRVVLMNAVAFEGNWIEPFGEPRRMDFTADDGAVKKADMLVETGRMQYLEVAGGRGFAREYGRAGSSEDRIAFVGLVPPEGMKVDEYLGALSGDAWMEAWNKSRDSSRRLSIRLPEFRYDYETSLTQPMQAMGMGIAFSDDADFSGMFVPGPDTQELRIDDILHKTHIELDRNGTKAAAVTAVVMKNAGCAPDPQETIEVYLDRPFVYMLVDTKTGIPLFAGILRDPGK